VEVPDYRAALGGKVRVPTLDGEVEMTLPRGTTTGRVLRLRGQGWPRKNGGRGDEMAEVRVVVPKDPTPEQQELYRQLEAQAEGDPAADASAGAAAGAETGGARKGKRGSKQAAA
jgi:curved DNA-binding protein